MTTITKLLSIEECDNAATDTFRLASEKRAYKQLADTMRENERLLELLHRYRITFDPLQKSGIENDDSWALQSSRHSVMEK